MELPALAVGPQPLLRRTAALPVPPVHGPSASPCPAGGANRRLSCAVSGVRAEPRRASAAPTRQGRHSKAYLDRQAAILEVQRSPDLDSALERFGSKLKASDLNAVLRYLGKTKRFQDLVKIFEWMRHNGKISSSSYTSYITYMGKFLSPVKALEIYRDIADPSMRINVYICNAVLGCLVKNGKFDSSLIVFQEMKQDGLIPDVVTYSTLLSGCMKVNDGYVKAVKLVSELEHDGLKMDSIIYGTLLAVCASNNQCQDAENFFQRMKDEGLEPNEFHYSSLLNAYSADGNHQKAEELVQLMKCAGLEPNKVVLTTLLKVYVKGGMFEKSRELLAELESMGYADDEMPYCLLMDGLAKTGQIDQAQLVFKTMADKSVKSDGFAHSIMISAFCRDGLLNEAKLLAKDFDTKYNRYDLVILNTMLCAYCRGGEMESVMQILKKMDEVAISPDCNTFHILIRYFCKEKLYLLAYKTLEDMHKKGYQVEEEVGSSLIFHLGQMKAYYEAYSVYNLLRGGKRTICESLHEKILHILIAGRLHKEAFMVVKDNLASISKPAMKKFADAFMKSGNVNLINGVLEVLHGSGYKIDKEIFQMAVSRYIVLPNKKDLLLHLLQWMPDRHYYIESSTRELILKNSHFFGGGVIKEVLSKHQRSPKAAGSYKAIGGAIKEVPLKHKRVPKPAESFKAGGRLNKEVLSEHRRFPKPVESFKAGGRLNKKVLSKHRRVPKPAESFKAGVRLNKEVLSEHWRVPKPRAAGSFKARNISSRSRSG